MQLHELLHWGEYSKDLPYSIGECHAEAISYIVGHRFGIQNPYSAGYLHSWGTTVDVLKKESKVVQKTAKHIIDQIDGTDVTDADESDAKKE